MKLKFDPSLEFQHDAINSVVEAFDGQVISQSGVTALQALQIDGLFQNELGMGNQLTLPEDQILSNIQKIQEAKVLKCHKEPIK